jgi:hypothetical protein
MSREPRHARARRHHTRQPPCPRCTPTEPFGQPVC